MKVLHILDHSLPYITGYSLRSHYIISLQREVGMNPLAVTSPMHEFVSNPMELIEGISHYRTFFPDDRLEETLNDWMNSPVWEGQSLTSIMNKAISRIVTSQKIDLIHAHSPFTNGLAALDVCRTQGIPLLYEVRDFYGNSAGGPESSKENPLISTFRQNLEAFLCQQAGAVVVMGKRQRERIINQGIPDENVYIIPNEEITQMLKPAQESNGFNNLSALNNLTDLADLVNPPDLLRKHNLQNDPVAGFICSFYKQEGVIPLLRIFLKVRERTSAVMSGCLSIDGEDGEECSGEESCMGEKSCMGEDEGRINQPHHDASGHIIYVGQVKPRNKERFHSLIDVLVYPRVKIDSTGKSVLSDPIEALAVSEDAMPGEATDLYKLAMDKQAGLFLREGDISNLAGKCLKHIMNKQMQQNREEMARHHEEMARRQPDRSHARLRILAQYVKIYKKLLTQ
jgi:glycogen synthase